MTSDPVEAPDLAVGSPERDAFYDRTHQRDPERPEPDVERLPVVPESSNIVSVGWARWGGGGDGADATPRTHGCQLMPALECGLLEVEFVAGSVYRYYHVAEAVALLMQARYGTPLRSVGSYFNAAIRNPSSRPESGIAYRRWA